ncbi:glycosyltransferase [Leuconostoc falkenbergense]|uniref:glycosyltransferase n=1 Tax=Leuconostoc falkenbergense TaxID=2766470 RepID=UPI0024A917CC|nr:glycosyltransferase [Leuconostoc falkenbergense]MDI6553856.1 glycosyltransferase [Leuconostoc falkenbergense]
MDYTITNVSFFENKLKFNTKYNITQLYVNDEQIEFVKRSNSVYELDFNSNSFDDFNTGRFHIFGKVNNKLVRLKTDEFQELVEVERYFKVKNQNSAFIYFTINGYLNFAVLSSVSYLNLLERSYDNFSAKNQDILINQFKVTNNVVIVNNTPKIDEVVAASQTGENEYLIPFVWENQQIKIDFSTLLNVNVDRYFIFFKIANRKIRLKYSNILTTTVENRYFELKKPYSVFEPDLDKTQNYLYFSVNGRLAFLKSARTAFQWKHYTGSERLEEIRFSLNTNELFIFLDDEPDLQNEYKLELRNEEELIHLTPTKQQKKSFTFSLENVRINERRKYLISLISVDSQQNIQNVLLKPKKLLTKQLVTKKYTVNKSIENGLLFLVFNNRQYHYNKRNHILAHAELVNSNTIFIEPEAFLFPSEFQIIAQSRVSKNEMSLEFRKQTNGYVVDISGVSNENIINDNTSEIFDVYCYIYGVKYNFRNIDALAQPVRNRYQELEVNDHRLSLYSTLGGTLALRKDQIDENSRKLYKYRSDDLLVSDIKQYDKFIKLTVPSKVYDVVQCIVLPRKGTDSKDVLDITYDKEKNMVKIFHFTNVAASKTNKLFNYLADYLLDWVDQKGIMHTSYLKAVDFERIESPLRKFEPYSPEQENYVLVQNYLNGVHNLSIKIQNLYYAENYEKFAIDDFLVLYESRDGQAFVDSPLSIFQYLTEHEEYKNLKHVVVLENVNGAVAAYNKKLFGDKITFVERNTEDYAKFLLTAKYLINNSTFQSFFLKKEKQVYINTWHGTPLKLMGMEMPYPANASQNVLRNFLMADYLVAQNDRMFDMYTKSYRLDGIYNGRITKFGYPRMDKLITEKEDNSDVLAQFDIKINKNLPTILYAPTHNGQNSSNPGEGVLKVVDDLMKLRSYFAQDYNLLIKVHPFVFELVKDNEWLKGSLIPDYIDTNYILQFVDILVTDFSSIFVDFLGVNKRIIFFVPNFDQYIQDRGVYDDVSAWPGEVVSNLADLRDLLEREEKPEYIDKRKNAINYYLKFDNGKATQKIVETVFDKKMLEDVISVYKEKKNILIYPGGMATNGITSVALNLTSKIDHETNNVFVLMNASNINDEDQFNNYLSLDKRNIPIFIFGKNILNIKDTILDYSYQTFGVPKQEDIPAPKLYSREMERLLPNIHIHAAIDFSGYSFYFSRYIIGTKTSKRFVYMHNDLYADSRRTVNGGMPHYHNLAVLFTAYKYFNRYINVSTASETVNRQKLGNIVDASKMTTIDNPLDIESIEKKGLEVMDWDNIQTINGEPVDFMNDNYTTFITAARLSPEKNQMNLVKAFAEFIKEQPNNRLFILGDGLLKEKLKNLIVQTHSEHNIFMLGRKDNPMPFIKNADVFVLPSLYEGQPMSMMEAMVLGIKYVLSSNIPQSVELLQNGKLGYLTDGVDTEFILDGLRNVKNKEYSKFDAESHNRKSMKLFDELLN